MFIGFFVVLLGVTLGQSADHGTFKDCSRVDFCKTLRAWNPSDDYYSDSYGIQLQDDSSTVYVPLKDREGNIKLSLKISSYVDSTFRIVVTEQNSTRYELQDVLVAEPVPLAVKSFELSDDIRLTSGSNQIIITLRPLNIRFIRDGTTFIDFLGDHISLSSNADTAPFSFGVRFAAAVQLYGIHEHCDTLALKSTVNSTDPYRLKNSDVAFYELDSPMALYGAVPVIYGHGTTGTAGVFLHNAAEQWIDVDNHDSGGSSVFWMAETGTLDLFVFLGPKPVDVVRQYTTLTGTAHLPQLWTLGYHQSRYSYETQDDARGVVSNFIENNFPLDGLWLDIDYTDGYKYFTWNPSNYNDPVALQNYISSVNKKLITIIDPHIKVEQGYQVYDGALSSNLFVKNSDGSVFQGPCWPGTSSYMDFLNPEAREYYGSMYSYDNFKGSTPTVAGIWNDMNEPSVFDNSLEMTLPANALHNGSVRHREIHNIYGYLHTMATHGGLLARDNNEKRPFVLTRSHFAGTQRYAAIWTGDNTADWPYLKASYQECLNSNMLGIVFCGADVGGFFNNPSEELFQRWYQAGAWLPFYRAHSNKDTNRREPYLFNEDVQNVVREAIKTRYQHIPHWYTIFYEHVRTGAPVVRPLYYHYPENSDVFKIDDQLLVGRDILVKAVTESNQGSTKVYFPGGQGEVWVSLFDDDVRTGIGYQDVNIDMSHIPVYYRWGTIIVNKMTERLNTIDQADDPYTLTYVLNTDNKAHGTVYLDDGTSFQYRDNKNYNYISIDVEGDEITFTQIDETNGNFEFKIDQIVKKEIIKNPSNGVPGRYKTSTYTTTAEGILLKHQPIKSTTTLKL